MKKTIISVVSTCLVLFIMAQLGWLELFGIHGLSIFTKKKEKPAAENNRYEYYTDSTSNMSYRFKIGRAHV